MTQNTERQNEPMGVHPGKSSDTKPAMSLLGAKSIMQQKLSAMYRGMRGLEAAHEAFAMCQVNIAVDVEDVVPKPEVAATRGKRHMKGKSNQRGRKYTRPNEQKGIEPTFTSRNGPKKGKKSSAKPTKEEHRVHGKDE